MVLDSLITCHKHEFRIIFLMKFLKNPQSGRIFIFHIILLLTSFQNTLYKSQTNREFADLDLGQSSPEAVSGLYAGCVSIDDEDPAFPLAKIIGNMGKYRLIDNTNSKKSELNCTTRRKIMHSRLMIIEPDHHSLENLSMD